MVSYKALNTLMKCTIPYACHAVWYGYVSQIHTTIKRIGAN